MRVVAIRMRPVLLASLVVLAVILGLPACPGSNVFSPGVPTKTASQATCATWDPYENPDPPGCDWFVRPPEPQ